jgi:DNA-binding transcriptional ArsR family regulator
MTAGELAGRFAHTWPTTTRHLSVLGKARLVTVRREGRERHYILNREHLATALGLWLPSVGLTGPQPRPPGRPDAAGTNDRGTDG